MKTQAKKTLTFEKGTITELNDTSLNQVNGGTGSASVAVQSVRPTSISVCLEIN